MTGMPSFTPMFLMSAISSAFIASSRPGAGASAIAPPAWAGANWWAAASVTFGVVAAPPLRSIGITTSFGPGVVKRLTTAC